MPRRHVWRSCLFWFNVVVAAFIAIPLPTGRSGDVADAIAWTLGYLIQDNDHSSYVLLDTRGISMVRPPSTIQLDWLEIRGVGTYVLPGRMYRALILPGPHQMQILLGSSMPHFAEMVELALARIDGSRGAT